MAMTVYFNDWRPPTPQPSPELPDGCSHLTFIKVNRTGENPILRPIYWVETDETVPVHVAVPKRTLTYANLVDDLATNLPRHIQVSFA